MRMTFDPAVFETMNDTSKKIDDAENCLSCNA